MSKPLPIPSVPPVAGNPALQQYLIMQRELLLRLASLSEIDLDDLDDVVISSAAANQYLCFDGTNWINSAIDEVTSTAAGLAPAAGTTEGYAHLATGTASTWGSVVTVASSAPTAFTGRLWLDSTDDTLYIYNGSTWVAIGAAAGATAHEWKFNDSVNSDQLAILLG